MKILAHRGYWKNEVEKNSLTAIARAFDNGFGIETDVRDHDGALVIAHDPPDANAREFRLILEQSIDSKCTIAVNIKADGLASMLKTLFFKHSQIDWFAFDMSIPDMITFAREGLPFFTRASEFENDPACYHAACGIWLDAFHSTWYEPQSIQNWLNDGKKVCIVSAELHRRDRQAHWQWILDSGIAKHANLMLCTDHPEDARAAFLSSE